MLTERELSIFLLYVFRFGSFVYVKDLVRTEDCLAFFLGEINDDDSVLKLECFENALDLDLPLKCRGFTVEQLVDINIAGIWCRRLARSHRRRGGLVRHH